MSVVGGECVVAADAVAVAERGESVFWEGQKSHLTVAVVGAVVVVVAAADE